MTEPSKDSVRFDPDFGIVITIKGEEDADEFEDILVGLGHEEYSTTFLEQGRIFYPGRKLSLAEAEAILARFRANQ